MGSEDAEDYTLLVDFIFTVMLNNDRAMRTELSSLKKLLSSKLGEEDLEFEPIAQDEPTDF